MATWLSSPRPYMQTAISPVCVMQTSCGTNGEVLINTLAFLFNDKSLTFLSLLPTRISPDGVTAMSFIATPFSIVIALWYLPVSSHKYIVSASPLPSQALFRPIGHTKQIPSLQKTLLTSVESACLILVSGSNREILTECSLVLRVPWPPPVPLPYTTWSYQ